MSHTVLLYQTSIRIRFGPETTTLFTFWVGFNQIWKTEYVKKDISRSIDYKIYNLTRQC